MYLQTSTSAGLSQRWISSVLMLSARLPPRSVAATWSTCSRLPTIMITGMVCKGRPPTPRWIADPRRLVSIPRRSRSLILSVRPRALALRAVLMQGMRVVSVSHCDVKIVVSLACSSRSHSELTLVQYVGGHGGLPMRLMSALSSIGRRYGGGGARP